MIISSEQLSALRGYDSVSGLIFVKNYSVALTKNGKEYITGTLQSGNTISFKCWNNSKAFEVLKNNECAGKVCHITGTGNQHEGVVSIVVDSASIVEDVSIDTFLPEVYVAESYWRALKDLVYSSITPACKDLCDKVLFQNDFVANRFKVEFAASSHHDNVKSGLLAHTYKVVAGVVNSWSMYSSLGKAYKNEEEFKDLLIMGALVHDIGKIKELNIGVYQKDSYITHNYLGIEFIEPYKADIINAYDEDWYYNLISIILQHHGEFGMRCNTVAAYIIHTIDFLDSRLSLLNQILRDVNPTEKRIKMDDFYLTLFREDDTSDEA